MSTTDPASRMWGDALTAHFNRREVHLPGVLGGDDRLPDVDPFDIDVNTVMAEAADLLIRKHHDYGPANIARSPGGPLNGLRVRIWDKVARINNLIDSGAEPENESLRDSWVDLLNYAAIALLVIDGKWPE